MAPYRWTINGRGFQELPPLEVTTGERLRLPLLNQSMMFHRMHVHGHTFWLACGDVRKDTVLVRPMQSLDIDLDATNLGRWAMHCHNAYHAERGMMIELRYMQ